jgi:hypothetical protein
MINFKVDQDVRESNVMACGRYTDSLKCILLYILLALDSGCIYLCSYIISTVRFSTHRQFGRSVE